MSYVFIDTNMKNGDGSYYVHNSDIIRKQLKAGDTVVAYQETDMWQAEVVRSGKGYGVILKSEASEISSERFEGHREGFNEGVLYSNIVFINLLKSLHADPCLIEEVKKLIFNDGTGF